MLLNINEVKNLGINPIFFCYLNMMDNISVCHIADVEVLIIFWLGRPCFQGFAVTTFYVPDALHTVVLLQLIC